MEEKNREGRIRRKRKEVVVCIKDVVGNKTPQLNLKTVRKEI